MALEPLTQLDEFELIDDDQDCRGWPVVDAGGRQIGTVREMLVDTEAQKVTVLVLDSGEQVPAGAISLAGGSVRVNQARAADVGDGTRASAEEDRVVVPVIEEQMSVGKREVAGGGVRVTTRLAERPVQESVTLQTEEVHVKRRDADRAVSAADASALKEGTLEVRARSEEAVIDKKVRVVGEVVITKDVTDREVPVHDTVRRTEVDVDRLEDDGSNAPTSGRAGEPGR